MATQPAQEVQQFYRSEPGSPYCCDPNCKSCQALRAEYDSLKENDSETRGSE
jgi:hypothetical protein